MDVGWKDAAGSPALKDWGQQIELRRRQECTVSRGGGDGDNFLTDADGRVVADADCKTSFERKSRNEDDNEAS
jgi:hypothetical protein